MFLTNAMRQLSVNRQLVNLLGNGNFGVDTDGNGLGNGLTSGAIINYVMADNTQYIEASTTSTVHYADFSLSPSITAGDKLYFCGLSKSSKGKSKLVLYNKDASGSTIELGSTLGTTSNLYEWHSVYMTITTVYSIPSVICRFLIHNASNSFVFAGTGENMQFKKCMLINLTKAFGSGKEPSKSDMDAFAQANSYFTQIDFLKV